MSELDYEGVERQRQEAFERNAIEVRELTWPAWLIAKHAEASCALMGEDEYEFADTWRDARKGNAQEEADYETIRLSGCCGSVDTEFTHIDPDTGESVVTLFGFNYGH